MLFVVPDLWEDAWVRDKSWGSQRIPLSSDQSTPCPIPARMMTNLCYIQLGPGHYSSALSRYTKEASTTVALTEEWLLVDLRAAVRREETR